MFNAINNLVGPALNRLLAPAKNAFVDKYKDKMICDVRQIGDVVPLWDPGICDAFVLDWFRRISAGRPTWQHRQQGTPKVTVFSTDKPNWNKKVERLKKLQASGKAYGEDSRFGYTDLPPPESTDRQTPLAQLENVAKGNAMQQGSDIWSALNAAWRTSSDDHVFFALRLQFDGVGHMIGLHMRRDTGGSTITGDVAPGALHVFDPNIGEFKTADDRSIFLADLLKVYDGKLVRFSVFQVKPWWGRGQAGQRFTYAGPAIDDDDM
jgi:hypothetical protein